MRTRGRNPQDSGGCKDSRRRITWRGVQCSSPNFRIPWREAPTRAYGGLVGLGRHFHESNDPIDLTKMLIQTSALLTVVGLVSGGQVARAQPVYDDLAIADSPIVVIGSLSAQGVRSEEGAERRVKLHCSVRVYGHVDEGDLLVHIGARIAECGPRLVGSVYGPKPRSRRVPLMGEVTSLSQANIWFLAVKKTASGEALVLQDVRCVQDVCFLEFYMALRERRYDKVRELVCSQDTRISWRCLALMAGQCTWRRPEALPWPFLAERYRGLVDMVPHTRGERELWSGVSRSRSEVIAALKSAVGHDHPFVRGVALAMLGLQDGVESHGIIKKSLRDRDWLVRLVGLGLAARLGLSLTSRDVAEAAPTEGDLARSQFEVDTASWYPVKGHQIPMAWGPLTIAGDVVAELAIRGGAEYAQVLAVFLTTEAACLATNGSDWPGGCPIGVVAQRGLSRIFGCEWPYDVRFALGLLDEVSERGAAGGEYLRSQLEARKAVLVARVEFVGKAGWVTILNESSRGLWIAASGVGRVNGVDQVVSFGPNRSAAEEQPFLLIGAKEELSLPLERIAWEVISPRVDKEITLFFECLKEPEGRSWMGTLDVDKVTFK